MAVIRVCDICDGRIYDNERFYTVIDTAKEGEYKMEICKKCFGAITEQIRNKKENSNDN